MIKQLTKYMMTATLPVLGVQYAEAHLSYNGRDFTTFQPDVVAKSVTIGNQTVTGSYLASRFAQNNGDWNAANKFVNDILDESPDNVDFQRKSMILAMGSGRYADAMNAANDCFEVHKENGTKCEFTP